MPNLGPNYDMAVRLKQLEDAVARLQQNPYGQAFSATQSDGSVGLSIAQYPGGAGATALIAYQGPETARDPNTGQHPTLLYVGQVQFADGTLADNGVLIFYGTGTNLAAFTQNGPNLFDQAGNVIVSNDSGAREGLGRPWIPLPTPVSAHFSQWPFTSSSGLIAESFFNSQHPKVYWNASVAADAGVTGTVQLTITCGSKSVSSQTYTYSGSQVNIGETLTMPQPFFDTLCTVAVNGTVTGGTGNLYCQTWLLTGRQS